jgi:hypothetical protein
MMEDTDTTYSTQLNEMCDYLFGNRFQGTFPADMVPPLNNNEMCILNTSESKEGGEHWVGLLQEKGKIYFFDTYNRPPHKITKIWSNKKWKYPNHQVMQPIVGKDCGQQTIAALLTMDYFGCMPFFNSIK